MRYTFLILIFLVSIVLSCKTSPVTNNVQKVSFEQEMREGFDGDIRLVYNEGRNFVICLEYRSPKTPPSYKAKKFLLFDLKKGSVIYEGSFINGSVEWMSNKRIKIVKGLGVITAEHPDGYITYIYDIETGTRKEELQFTK